MKLFFGIGFWDGRPMDFFSLSFALHDTLESDWRNSCNSSNSGMGAFAGS